MTWRDRVYAEEDMTQLETALGERDWREAMNVAECLLGHLEELEKGGDE